MEKYGRVLVIIFFLILINLGLSTYVISKLNKPMIEKVTPTVAIQKTATPSATITAPPNIQSDLTIIRSDVGVIKAEIRALRDSLEITGLITQTPTP